jgi:CRP/FNR family transcriptional regulator, cyclic AMP receptor protein
MTAVDGLGFLAAGLVLLTFCMKRLVPLRAIAITSNLAFILYGYRAGIQPVLMLHLVLLPVNLIRLLQALSISRKPGGAVTPRPILEVQSRYST